VADLSFRPVVKFRRNRDRKILPLWLPRREREGDLLPTLIVKSDQQERRIPLTWGDL
jgi:hypothetical protein